ncbi:MAG: hypothetical protein KatS3mg031_0154 [Chitinophagales bacterium]|nr:MAG: hypothetical protein KatS3mg031_0154 [Chitinophagales bacterium]
MKQVIILITILCALDTQAQLTPDYKVPVPDEVTLNHSCMTGYMQNIFQNINTHSDPYSAQFTSVVSDAAGNLYFTGYADFTTTPPTDPNYPYAGPEITFSSNVAPDTRQRLSNYKHFLASYHPNGSLRWVNFFTEDPKKLLWNEAEQKLFVLFSTGNDIGFNGTYFPTDSAYQSNEHIIFTFEPNEGIFQGIYKNRYTQDLIIAGNKTILVYYRQYTTTYFETRYGFFENNQVTKWQLPPSGVSDLMHQLYYNPYDNSLWFLNNLGDKYYRLFVSSTADTLTFENIAHNLNKEIGFPIQNIKAIDKFHFLPDGGYIGEYYTRQDIPGHSPQKGLKLVRVDASGNVVWRTEFSPQNEMWHTALVDGNGDVWVDLPTTAYYDKCKAVTAGKEYTVSPWGNVGVVNNFLLKLDGATGDIKNAYINGYGNVNYAMEISFFTNMQLLHLTAGNKLITTPQIGGIAYYPDATGTFQPYYAACSNQLLPSQFMWVSFDLNNLQAFKREELDEESIYHSPAISTTIPLLSVYPNPSQHEFTLISDKEQVFELYDMTGKQIDKFPVEINQPFIYRNQLPQGMYLLLGKENGATMKIVVK